MRNSQDVHQPRNLRKLSPVVVLKNYKNGNLLETPDSLARNLTSARVVIESPMKLPPPPIENKIDKTSFLNLFNLKPRTLNNGYEKPVEEIKEELCPRVSRNGILQLGLSSNIGQKLLDRHLMSNPSECVVKYEKYCYLSNRQIYNITNPRDKGEVNFNITYFVKDQPYYHQYSFNKQQRLERLKTINTGVSKRSRRLLQQCKRLKIYLKNLSANDIKRLSKCKYERSPVKSIELIDLVDSDEENEPNRSSSDNKCTTLKSAANVNSFARDALPIENGVLFPTVQNKVSIILKSLATVSKPVVNQILPNKNNLTPGIKRIQQLAPNSFLRKSPRQWESRTSEKDSDSDSDVEIISWNYGGIKQNNLKVNNGKTVGFKTHSNKQVTNSDIPNGRLSTNLQINEVLVKCKLCQFVEYCDIILLEKRIQHHMKMSHRGWQEVVVVNRTESCPVRKRSIFVAEAHVKDPIVI